MPDHQTLSEPEIAAKVLRHARGLIERPEAWVKGIPTNKDCRCAGYAIDDAARALQLPKKGARRAIVEVLAPAAHPEETDDVYFIIDWNDLPERTHSDVLAAFDRAIALAEGAV